VDGDPQLTAQVAAAAPYTGFLGMEIVSASPDEVRSRLAWSADKCTAGGMLHGGALMSLADSAGGFLAFLNLPADAKGTATIESKTNFLGPIRAGHVNAVSRALQWNAELRVRRRDIDELERREARLTRREREVCALVVTGRLNKQIAATLGTSEKTVKVHRSRVMTKMEVASLAELVRTVERLNRAHSSAEANGQ